MKGFLLFFLQQIMLGSDYYTKEANGMITAPNWFVRVISNKVRYIPAVIYIYSFIVGCETQPNKRTWVNSKYIQRATVSWTRGKSTKCYITYNTKEYIQHKIWESRHSVQRVA